MATKLTLLLDECMQDELSEAVPKCGGILSIECINAAHPLGNRKTPDGEVVRYACDHRRVLVTTEGRLNEKKFEICTHHGIIVIKATKRHESIKAELFTKFMKSEYRRKSIHAVTYLKLEGSFSRYRDDKGVIRDFPIRLD